MDIEEQFSEDLKLAVERTFSRMFAINVTSDFEKSAKADLITGSDVYGAVSLVNESIMGSFVVGFPKETLFKLLKIFYKKDFVELDRTSHQMVGELTNIIFGVFKNQENERGIAFKMAIPQIIVAESHRVPAADLIFHGNFQSDLGPFKVHIAVKTVD